MRIALIIPRLLPHETEAERTTTRLAAGLAARGHAVTLLTNWAGHGAAIPGVVLRTRRKGPGRFWFVQWCRFVRWLAREIQHGQFDRVISLTSMVAAPVMLPLEGTYRSYHRQLQRVPLPLLKSLRWRIRLALSPRHRMMLRWERRALTDAQVDRYAAVSPVAARQLSHDYNIESGRIRSLPIAWFGDEREVADDHDLRAAVRRAFGIGDNDVVYLFAADNPWLKGGQAVMQSMLHVLESDKRAMLVLAGRIHHTYHDRAVRWRIRDRVRIAATTRQLDAVLAAADVVLYPAIYEAAGDLVAKAVQRNLPVIISRQVGHHPLVAGNGIKPRGIVLDDPHDVAALTQAMLDMLDANVRLRYADDQSETDNSAQMPDAFVDQIQSMLTDAP